jgi:hypothetical protein
VDIDSYPEKHELDLIRNWDREWEYLFEHIKDRWRNADCGYWEEPEPRMYKIFTGGWNWNKELVDAMKQHKIFWLICWYSSKRGGHYEFRIPSTEGLTLKQNKFSLIGKRQNTPNNRYVAELIQRNCLTGI